MSEYRDEPEVDVEQVGGPEEPEDEGGPQLDTAKALGVTEPPSAKTQILLDQHPEIWPDYEETVKEKLIINDAYPPQNDARHTTYPFLTLYEKTKVIGLRASQLAQGAPPFIDIPESKSSSGANAGDSAVLMAVGSKWVYLGGSAVAS